MDMLDYLKWRGDLSLDVDPFNEVDAACFAESAYVDIEKYIKEDKLSLKEASKLYFIDHTYEDIKKSKSFTAKAPIIYLYLGETERFKDSVVHDYVSIFNREEYTQFCAFQVDLPNDITLVCFRGTDDSMAGWRENLLISYMITASQKLALDYVKTKLKKTRKYIFIGHSKGGNLAIYAAMNAPKRVRDKIINIYSLDGPGLNDEITSLENYKEFKDRYIKLVPEYDVFGVLFEKEIRYEIIASNASGIMQHSLPSWQVMRNRFIRLNKTSNDSETLRNEFNKFLASVDMNKRELFVKELFKALDELKVNNIYEIVSAGLPAFSRAIKVVGEMDSEGKAVANHLLEIFSNVINAKITDTFNKFTKKDK